MPRKVVNEVGVTISRNTIEDFLQKGDIKGKFFRVLKGISAVYEVVDLWGTKMRPTSVECKMHYLSDGGYVCSDGVGFPLSQSGFYFEATHEELETIKRGKTIHRFSEGTH